MTRDVFKVTVHMATSLDGVIAKRDNSVSWFEAADHYEKGVTATEQDVVQFLKTIDCYVMGARTYEHALELSKSYGWAYGDVPVIVLSHKQLPVDRPAIEIYSGSLENLVNERLKPNYKNVWVVGGAMLAGDFIRSKLADQIRLSVIPVILGDGLRFFDHIGDEYALHLEEATAHKNGVVELCYAIKTNN
ncbi:MAG: dihydrofolate reductase [Bacteroidetes bacterium]|nr:dihydrofolate reductase [Bacteroidota bacterium]